MESPLACKGQSTAMVSEVALGAAPFDWHGPPAQRYRDKVHSFPTLIFHTLSAPFASKLHATSPQASTASAKHATNPAVALQRKPPHQGKPVALQLALRLTPSERPIMSDYVAFDAQQALDGFVFDPSLDLDLDFDFDDWVDLPLPDFHPFDASQPGTLDAPLPSLAYPAPSVAHAQDPVEYESTERSATLPSTVTIASGSSHTEHGSVSTKRFKCDVPGCSHKGTFSRRHELRRHARAKHGDAKEFMCLALGCFRRGSTRWSFSRVDKLTDHIRLAHDHDTSFTGCPVDNCNFRSCALGVLGIHLRRAYKHYPLKAEARAIANATSVERRKCPFSGCNNRLYALNDFLTHLGDHSPDDLQAAQLNPSLEGIVFGTAPGRVGTGDSNISNSLSIACPVFSVTISNFEQFKEHLWDSHLFLDSLHGIQHFLAWDGACGYRKNSVPWDNSISRWSARRQTIQCPQCTHSVPVISLGDYILQHPGLLKPTDQVIAELGPFRTQILRLYPDFLTHPIFDDCL